MRVGRRANTGRKEGEVISKVPKVEFDMDAIKEIKRRKKRIYKKRVNQSNRLKSAKTKKAEIQ
jgi:hypothetical protein